MSFPTIESVIQKLNQCFILSHTDPQKALIKIKEIQTHEGFVVPHNERAHFFFVYEYAALLHFRQIIISPRESSYYGSLREYLGKLHDGFVDIKSIRGYMPDVLAVDSADDLIIAEVKRGSFDIHAKEQLNRYVDFYKPRYIYAVGMELTCTLPRDFKFIALSDL